MERAEQIGGGKAVATVLAIGTANPPNFILQEEYPDFYFRVTNSDHLHRLKQKFKRICMFLISASHSFTYILDKYLVRMNLFKLLSKNEFITDLS